MASDLHRQKIWAAAVASLLSPAMPASAQEILLHAGRSINRPVPSLYRLPSSEMRWLNRRNAHVQWLQFVAGVEAGRVADDFDLGTLHSDMKVVGLLGLRLMVSTLIVRADYGLTDEGGRCR